MLFVDNIIEIVKLGIASSYLKNEKTYLNLILLANPEAGKSSILLNFNFNKLKNVFVFSDLTKTKVEDFLKKLNNPHQNLKYIIIPDLTRLFSHRKDTQRGLLGLLNSGLEEGIYDITTYYSTSLQETKRFEKPLRFGIATSMTRQMISDRRRTRYWYSIGFLSRFLPVSFRYSKEQIKKIREYIASGKDLSNEPEILKLKPASIKCNPKYVLKLDPYIDKLAEASVLYGFRYTRQFRIMLKASALLRNSDKVCNKDVKHVEKLLHWINLDYNMVE